MIVLYNPDLLLEPLLLLLQLPPLFVPHLRQVEREELPLGLTIPRHSGYLLGEDHALPRPLV
jgi:hypothetical protein